MAVVDYVESWSDRLLSRLYFQFKDDATWQLWCTDVLGPQAQDLEDAAQTLLLLFDIDNIFGTQLDLLGRIVGQPRAGFNDPTYRIYIKARIAANISDGSPPAIYRVFALLFAAHGLKISTSRSKAFSLTITGAITDAQATIGVSFLHDTKEAGARAILLWQEGLDANMFTFAQATTVRTAANIGNATLAVRDLSILPASGSVTIDPGLSTAETIAYTAIALSGGAPVMTLVGTLAKAHAVGAVVERVGDVGLGWGDSGNPATGGEFAGAAQA